MHVRRIEMIGFKSFVDRTTVDLEPGIAAIVGPNGCGKTNICDAIRWVLGEENVRLLRGSRMEDVIFAGSEIRKATGMAEVSLSLADVEDTLPIDCNEVTVTRRAFRSGESEFFINRVPSRLKDIVSLFLGTGMGRRAYSVMERDMIDWILDDTSGQRRKIIEEAAGVSKYKVRRKETMNKLELTQRDLERVEDLISEVERRVRHLSRQAAKARRYERLVDRIKRVETYASVKEYRVMKAKSAEVEKEIGAVDIRMAATAKNISVLEARAETLKLKIIEIDEEANAHGKKASAVSREIQKAENERIVISERRRAIDEKVEELDKRRKDKRALIGGKEGMLGDKQEEIKLSSEKLDSLVALNENLGTKLKTAEGELRSRRERSVESAKQRLETMKSSMDRASALAELRSRKAHLGELLGKSEAKLAHLGGRVSDLQEEVGRIRPELEDLKSAFAKEDGELKDLSGTVGDVAGKIDEIREEHARLTKEAARASSRHDLLKELVERYEGYESGVRALMQGESRREGVHGVVGDIVKCVEARYEPAVLAALSNALQYVVIDGKDRAARSVQLLRDDRKGPATLVMLDSIPQGRGESPSHGRDQGVIGRITDFVECEPKYRNLIDYLLEDVFVVDSLKNAFSLSGEGSATSSYVTVDGDAVFRGSIVRAGSDGNGGGVYIGRKEKVVELATEAEALGKLAEEQETAFGELKRSLEELKRERNQKRARQEERQQAIGERERFLGSRVSELGTLEASRAELQAEIGSLAESLQAVEEDLAGFTEDVHIRATEQADLFGDIADHAEIEKRVEQFRNDWDQNNEEILKLRSNLGFVEDTVKRLNQEIGHLRQDIGDLDKKENDLITRKDSFSQDEERIRKDIQKLAEALSDLEAKRSQALDRKRGIETEIEEARKRIRSSLAEKEGFLAKKQELQSEANLMGVKCDALRQRMLEEYEIDIGSINLDELKACENWEEELGRLRGHLRNLGPVNLVALEEYGTEKERYDFLKSQRDDLIKARESLDEAILQINRRARSGFAETFDKVRKDFRKNFQTLFEGGDADLRLRYEGDPLESPVDILAQPSGKKLEHISLLSGGERALTAIAFLFAVYYTRPSPFCLLDEVDAPLDDANVARFINLIKDFSHKTQFLIVTHNKKSMEAASCLYGVTMEEPGISRMVSVRLHQGEKKVLEPVTA